MIRTRAIPFLPVPLLLALACGATLSGCCWP
ncbi:hypothetical protein CLU94_4786 [Janthinobacterium sp. 13]|nr:hypothetical protein CLU94_4786 [Janthinobacterium sp. 13]